MWINKLDITRFMLSILFETTLTPQLERGYFEIQKRLLWKSMGIIKTFYSTIGRWFYT